MDLIDQIFLILLQNTMREIEILASRGQTELLDYADTHGY